MSGPYDAVLRLRRREMDDYGVAISGAREQLDRISDAKTRSIEEMKRQSRLGADDPLLASHHYLARMRRQREELAHAEVQADAARERLRNEAAQALASLRATEESAEQHQAEEDLAVARKEQGEFDDLSAARLARSGK